VCEKHRVEVVDHKEEHHFLESDAECRNTLFNGKPQSALQLLPGLKALGVGRFRVELLHENAEQARRKVSMCAQALAGTLSIADVLRQLGAEEKYGISAGQLFNGGHWKDRKKEARRI